MAAPHSANTKLRILSRGNRKNPCLCRICFTDTGAGAPRLMAVSEGKGHRSVSMRPKMRFTSSLSLLA